MTECTDPLILVVEDDDAIRKLICDTLKLFHFRPAVAADGAEAIAMAREQRPQLILMDLQLPGISGLDTAGRIRQLPGLAGCPIVAVTAYSEFDDTHQRIEATFDDRLGKPFAIMDLVAIVERHLGNGRHGAS